MADYTLFTPGPVDVPKDILNELNQPVLYHRDESFSQVLSQVQRAIKELLGSTGRVYVFTSSGTGALEATCANLLSSKDKPIVAMCGKFGQRWLEICRAFHIEPILIKEDYGKSIKPETIENALQKTGEKTTILTTLTETSTGALNDIQQMGKIAQQYNAFLVVDGIAGIGADECWQDKWNMDVLIGASQKALMAPAGISFLSISERVHQHMEHSDLPKYYFDLKIYDKFLTRPQTPWTPAVNILYSLKKGLEKILSMGIENNIKKHHRLAQHVRERIVKMGFELLPEHPSNALTVIKMPDNIKSTPIINMIKEKYNILFANGQADLKGTIIRIGHMGNYDIPKLDKALDALESTIKQQRGKYE